MPSLDCDYPTQQLFLLKPAPYRPSKQCSQVQAAIPITNLQFTCSDVLDAHVYRLLCILQMGPQFHKRLQHKHKSKPVKHHLPPSCWPKSNPTRFTRLTVMKQQGWYLGTARIAQPVLQRMLSQLCVAVLRILRYSLVPWLLLCF